MKRNIFINALLAACAACVAQAETTEETLIKSGNKTYDSLTTNRLQIGDSGGKGTVTVTGTTTINPNHPGTTKPNANQIQAGSALVSDSVIFNSATNAWSKTFYIYGTVTTNNFTVSAEDGYTADVRVQNKGSIVSPSGEAGTGTLVIGKNASVNAGSYGGYAANGGTLKVNTEVNGGGILHVYQNATIEGDIILNGGSVIIEPTLDQNASLSLQEAAIVSDITVNSGSLQFLGDCQTGALTLKGGTINVGSELVKATLTMDGDFLLEGATLNLINGDLQEVTMKSGSIDVGSGSTIGSLTLYGGDLSGDLSGCNLKTRGEVTVDVTGAEITAEEGELSGTISESTLTMEDGALVRGSVENSDIIASGGEISGAISGTSTVEVTGGTTVISGENNDYSGGTKVNRGELAVGSDKALGTGKVSLEDGILNLGSQAVSNDIEAASGVIRGADKYDGNLVVSDDLTIEGSVTAKSITMLNNASIVLQEAATYSRRSTAAAAVARTDAMYVYTEGDGHFTGSLTLNDGGLIEFKNGNSLVVTGTLTLGNGTRLVLNGDYAAGDTLVSATETLTLGEVTLVYDNNAVVMEQQGNSLVLVGNFKQEKAIACTLTNWGIATASRAVVNAVRGQRSNTGCIADGKGTAWVASLGSKHEINGSDIDISGAAVGADMQVGRNSRVGIALGYAEGEVQPTGLRQVDQEGSYLAVYGEHGLKKLSATSCLSMDWVAAYGVTDSEVAGLKWEQDSLQLNSRVNWNKKVTDKLCMSVFGGLEYFANNSDTVDGVKTGSIQNLRGEIGVGARYVAWGTPAVTDGKSGLVLSNGCEKLVLNGEVRYMNDMVRSNPVIRMNGLSGMGENPGRQGMGIEAGATYRIGERWSASANYGFNTMEDSKEHRVNVGASYTF